MGLRLRSIKLLEDFKTSTKRFKDQGADPSEVEAYISDFKEMKPKIKELTQKDIDKWKTWDEFKAFVDQLKTTKTKGQEKKEKKMAGAKLVAEDKYWRVYQITTHEAAKLYGSGTKWCITHDHYWKDYSSHSDFYFYISKRLPPSSPFYKIALENDDGKKTLWDAQDKSYGHDEGNFYSRRGSIPFKLPDIPEDILRARQQERENEKPLYTIFLKTGVIFDDDTIGKLEMTFGDSISNVPYPDVAVADGDFINLDTDNEALAKKAIEIIGKEKIKEVSPKLEESLLIEVNGKTYGYI